MIRSATEADFERITAAIARWWDSPEMDTEAARRERSALVPRLYLQHFAETCFLVDDAAGQLMAFLIGFDSVSRPEEAYIHFVGVHPSARGRGVGRRLYEHFFDRSRAAGRRRIRCITSPQDSRSIAFHEAMGFTREAGDHTVDGVACKRDYDGPLLHRVAFVRAVA